MAGPPFSIDPTTPAATDVVSAFPANEQLNRSNILSWLTWLSDPTTGIINSAALPNTTLAIPGYLLGLTLSDTAGAPTTSIDIAAGQATSQNLATPMSIVLASAITAKSLAAGWAVGSNTGMLDTGTAANATYHIFLIRRSDTGVVDVCASLSPTTPVTGGNIPAAYDSWRRIGSILRVASVIRPFLQLGDTFTLISPIANRSNPAAAAPALVSLSVPLGIVVEPIISHFMAASAASAAFAALGSALAGTSTGIIQQVSSGGADIAYVNGGFWTNTSAQLWFSLSVSAGTLLNADLRTLGWIDKRGRI